MNFPKFWALDRSGAFMSWRCSNTSLEEAQSAAAEAAQRLAQLWAQGKMRLETYGYPDRPLREPVLQEIRNAEGELSAVITRNSYGCQILNTARAMFVDVDLPETRTKSEGLFGSLFGRKADPPTDPAHAVIAKAEDWSKKHAGWNWRIYRTAAGVRLLATHALFDPKDQACQDAFADARRIEWRDCAAPDRSHDRWWGGYRNTRIFPPWAGPERRGRRSPARWAKLL